MALILKPLFAILSHESCVKDWNVWKIPLTQKFPISHVVNHIAWVAFTVHVFGTNENYEKISAPKYEWSNQKETAEKRSTKLRKKTLHSRKRALNPYVQDVVLIIYCIHSFPTIIYKGNSAGRDENSLGKQKSLIDGHFFSEQNNYCLTCLILIMDSRHDLKVAKIKFRLLVKNLSKLLQGSILFFQEKGRYKSECISCIVGIIRHTSIIGVPCI